MCRQYEEDDWCSSCRYRATYNLNKGTCDAEFARHVVSNPVQLAMICVLVVAGAGGHR
jgi:hypothetical protein